MVTENVTSSSAISTKVLHTTSFVDSTSDVLAHLNLFKFRSRKIAKSSGLLFHCWDLLVLWISDARALSSCCSALHALCSFVALFLCFSIAPLLHCFISPPLNCFPSLSPPLTLTACAVSLTFCCWSALVMPCYSALLFFVCCFDDVMLCCFASPFVWVPVILVLCGSNAQHWVDQVLWFSCVLLCFPVKCSFCCDALLL